MVDQEVLAYWQRREQWCRDHEEPLYVSHPEFYELSCLATELDRQFFQKTIDPPIIKELVKKIPVDVRINTKKAERQKRLFYRDS